MGIDYYELGVSLRRTSVLKLNIKYVETLRHTLTAGELPHIQSLCGRTRVI